MEVSRAIATVALVVVVALTGPGAGVAQSHHPGLGGSPAAESQTGVGAETDPVLTQVDTDQIRLVVSVQPDGDAVWQVEYRTNLNDQNTTTAFESLAADIEQDPENYTDRFASRIQSTVASAENATGREMSARNVSVSASTDSLNSQGVVTYRYEWTNFAAVDGDRLVIGDAIAGFFLDSRTSLEVQWPEGYGVTEVAPDPDSQSGRALSWRGSQTDFGPDQPRVVVEEGAESVGPNGGGGIGGLPAWLVAVVVVLAAGVVVAVVAWRGTDSPEPKPTSSTGPAGDAGGVGVAGANEGEGDGDGESGSEGRVDGREGDEEPIDEELLSNEERVLRLLERRGGRIKQQEIVEALDWAEAKTSQVVSGMREEGTIDGFRLGRENVLTLPDEEITPDDEGGGDGDEDGDGDEGRGADWSE